MPKRPIRGQARVVSLSGLRSGFLRLPRFSFLDCVVVLKVWFDPANHRPNREGDAGSDHEVPRISHVGKSKDIENGGQSSEHAAEGAARICSAVERAQEKKS